MPIININQTNFASGELSPKVWGRFELELYKNGTERMQNFIAELQGSARFRTGSRFVNYTRLNKLAFLIPFQYNDEQSYILEFTNLKMRVFKDEGAVVESEKNITGATQADPVVITSVAHGYANGDETYIGDVEGMTELNGKFYIIANKTANTYELTDIDGNDIDGTGFSAYTSGGISERIFELTTPYLESELFELKFAQNADIMNIVHPMHDIRKLTRTDHDAWTMSTFSRTIDPFASKTITGATQADPVVITAVAHGFANGDIVPIQEVVGMVELNGVAFKVANKAANTFELQNLNETDIDGTGYTAYVSGGKVGKFPSSVAYFEGRIFYAGTLGKPETFWGSRSPNTTTGNARFEDFTTGTDADHSVVFTLSPSAQGRVDHIEWLAGGIEFLLCGTFGGITKITGDGVNEPITPTSINAKPVTGEGVADQNPIPLGGILLFTQRGGLNMRSFEFDILVDSFISVDRNLVADHMTISGVNQIAFQNGRPDILWTVKENGEFIGITFKSKEDVSGWHRHLFGGTNTKAKSVATIAMPNAHDQVWFVVERTINSLTRRSVEFLEDEPTIPEFENFYTDKANKESDINAYENAMFEIQKEYIHLDSMLTYDGTLVGLNAGASMAPSATTGIGITFTASQSVFTSSDVGREIWKQSINGVGEGRAEITSYTSGTVVTCSIKKDFDNTTAMVAGNWYLTTDAVSGVDHLEAESATVVVDGSKHTKQTVSNGIILLEHQASVIHVGLGFTGLLKSLNLEGGAANFGSSQTRLRNIEHATIKFLNTLGAKVGTDRYNLENIHFRSSAHSTNRPAPLFSGNIPVIFSEGTEIEKHFYVEQTSPLPCVVQFIDIYMDTTLE